VIIREKVITLSNFKPIKPLGCGDTGSVHLVELMGTGELFAMKIMDKDVMLNRNKVHRVCLERQILSLLDHPFLPSLYTSFQCARPLDDSGDGVERGDPREVCDAFMARRFWRLVKDLLLYVWMKQRFFDGGLGHHAKIE
ncbi:Phototropin-2, partial [Zostera marina]